MAGIFCSFGEASGEIDHLIELMDHRGDYISKKEMTFNRSQFRCAVVHTENERAIIERDNGIIIIDSLYGLTEEILKVISNRSMLYGAIANGLRRTQGLVVIQVSPTDAKVWRSSDGQRAIYYGRVSQRTVFATEKKVLWNVGCKDASPVKPGCILGVDQTGNTTVLHNSEPRRDLWSDTKYQALGLLERYLRASIENLRGRSCGILFSGGVDSSLLAHIIRQIAGSTCLFSASMIGSRDHKHVKSAAERLGLPVVIETLTPTDIWKAIPRVILAIETTNRMDVEIALPFFFSATAAKNAGVEIMVSGQGPDEQFAGYARHVRILESQGEEAVVRCLQEELAITHEANISRDERVIASIGLPVAFPYLDPQFTDLAQSLPVSWKIQLNSVPQRKLIFRKLAMGLGLPPDLATTPKKATQFSSGSSRGLTSAISGNVEACANMSKREVDSIAQQVLDTIGGVLGLPVAYDKENPLGIDLTPASKIKEYPRY